GRAAQAPGLSRPSHDGAAVLAAPANQPRWDHADFSADGRYMHLSCEYLGAMIELDLQGQARIIRTLDLTPKPASPQDVKLAPDGKLLYAADQDRAGLWEIDPASFTAVGFLPTGAVAHGLYPTPDP